MSIKTKVSKVLKALLTKKQFPILLGIFLCMLVAGLWKALENQEHYNRYKAVETEAQKIVALVNIDLQSRIKSLERITNRWEIREGTPKDEFEKDALAYIVDSPGYQAIEWVDRTFHVRWIIPLKGNEAAQNLNLAFENNRRIALENARDRKFPTLTSPIDLIQGGKGFLVYHPIFVKEMFEGFVLAVFRTQKWLTHILQSKTSPKEKRKFLALISMDGKQIYSHEHWDKKKEAEWAVTVETYLYGHSFSIRCQPTDSFIRQSHSVLPEMVLGAGVLLSILSSVIVFLIQKAKKAIQETLASKVALENEIIVRKQAESSLAKERQRLAYILAGTNVGTWEWNVQTGETIFNKRWANIIGYNLEELAPISIDTWTKFVHPDDLKISSDLLEKHFNGELDYYECEARMRHKDGSWVWVLDRGRISTKTDDGKPLLMSGTHQGITRQKQIEEKISHLATHDTLTDLPSLRLANDRISMAIESAKRNQSLAATLFVDLDGFKMINDTHGHNAGDAVLREVAKRLLSCVRKTDTVARVGGDEFLLVITAFQNNDLAASIAKKIINILAQSIPFERVQLTVGASIGIAIYPNDCDSGETLIKQADEAMYVSKKSGKNRYTFANAVKS
jgi:diguanylate cyclase (GGDEF)-like protein/PAS domain S-box-containing protein